MPELKVSAWARVMAFVLVLAAPVSAQQSFSSAGIGEFGKNYGCAVGGPYRNQPQYFGWIDFLEGLFTGEFDATIFEECPTSPYAKLSGILEGRSSINDLIDDRRRLAAYMTPQDGQTAEIARQRQGYGATEYLFYVYVGCQADRVCYEETLTADGFLSLICPSSDVGDTDRTSPDNFEMALFQNGGDMRVFLPYLVTNCRLLGRSVEQSGTTVLYDTVAAIFAP